MPHRFSLESRHPALFWLCVMFAWFAALLITQPVVVASTRIVEVSLDGTLLEDKEVLLQTLELAPGSEWTPAIRERVTKRLDRLGYQVEIGETTGEQGVSLVLKLGPYPLIRRIYIEGTTPLLEIFDAIFESDVHRRIGFHSGDRLPQGTAQTARFAQESQRVVEYLHKMGFFEAEVELRVEATSRPDQVNLRYLLSKGPRYFLGHVEPRGNNAIASTEIRDVISDEYRFLFLRFPFTDDRLDAAIESTIGRYHEHGYPGVRVNPDFDAGKDLDPLRKGARLGVQIRERRQVDVRFFVDGDPVGPDTTAELKEVITLFRNGSYDQVELEASARELEHEYQRDGRFHAKVTVSRSRTNRQTDQIDFFVERGPELRVHRVIFAGNRSFSPEALYDAIETREFNFWRWVKLSAGGYATTLQLQQDEKRLLDWYRQRGFPDVTVHAYEKPSVAMSALDHTARQHRGKDLYVHFVIDEGPRMTVEEVTFEPRSWIASALPRLALRPGKPYDQALLPSDQARLLRALTEEGYLYAEVGEPTVEKLQNGKVRIRYPFRENVPARFGPIVIRGNFKTAERVVRAEITFHPGDTFDIAQLEASERNLRSLGIFSTVRWALLGADEKSQTVTTLIEVEERYDDAGSFELGGGASTDNLVFGLLTYRNQNLLGLGQVLELQTEYGIQIKSGRGTFTDRRLLGSRLQLDITGFVRSEETERLGPLFTVGATATLSRKLANRLRAYLRYEFQRVRLEKDLFRAEGPVDEPDTVELTPRTGALGPGLLWDWRDRPFAPTCGYSSGTFAQLASPYLGGQDTFVRFHADAQMYLPLSGDAAAFTRGCAGKPAQGPLRAPFTLAQAVRYDHGFPLGNDAFLPEIERFFAGGDTTVRGFEEDRLRATLIEYQVAPGVTAFRAVPQGGNIRLIHNLELWFPLWERSFLLGLPLVGAVFVDNGLITNSFSGFGLTDLRHSAGAAVRISAPFGFISFEYAWPLDPETADDASGRLHLNFGAAFQF